MDQVREKSQLLFCISLFSWKSIQYKSEASFLSISYDKFFEQKLPIDKRALKLGFLKDPEVSLRAISFSNLTNENRATPRY